MNYVVLSLINTRYPPTGKSPFELDSREGQRRNSAQLVTYFSKCIESFFKHQQRHCHEFLGHMKRFHKDLPPPRQPPPPTTFESVLMNQEFRFRLFKGKRA